MVEQVSEPPRHIKRCAVAVAVAAAMGVGLVGPAALADETAGTRAYLPPGIAVSSSSYWIVGVAFDRAADNVVREQLIDDQLFGPSVVHRWGALGLGSKLMLSPNFDAIENVRGLAALMARYRVQIAGRPWMLGVAGGIEARLHDHFWLAYLSPVEIGAPLYTDGTARVYLFVGLRRNIAGQLINSYLIDPNGFDNGNAERVLADEKSAPWEASISLVFGRRID